MALDSFLYFILQPRLKITVALVMALIFITKSNENGIKS